MAVAAFSEEAVAIRGEVDTASVFSERAAMGEHEHIPAAPSIFGHLGQRAPTVQVPLAPGGSRKPSYGATEGKKAAPKSLGSKKPSPESRQEVSPQASGGKRLAPKLVGEKAPASKSAGSEQPALESAGAKRPAPESGVASRPIKQACTTFSK